MQPTLQMSNALLYPYNHTLTHINSSDCGDLSIEHDLRSPVPSRGHIFSEETCVIMFRVRHPREAKVTNLEIASCVQQQVTGLQVTMEDIGRVDILEAPENLVEKVANVVITESLGLEQLVEVSLHQALDNVDITETVDVDWTEDVADIDDILVLEPVEDLDLPEGSLAVSLMLKRADLLDGNLALSLDIQSGHNHPVGALPDVLEVEIPVTDTEHLAPDELRRGGARKRLGGGAQHRGGGGQSRGHAESGAGVGSDLKY